MPGEKVYTEQEWNDMENHYMHQLDIEKARVYRLEQLVSGLTKGIHQNKEENMRLVYFLEVMAEVIEVTSEAFRELRESSIKQNG